MATTGTFTFALDNADVITDAFERLGFNPGELDGPKLRSALRSLSLLLNSEWSNRGVNLWTVYNQSFALTQGQQFVTLPVGTIAVLNGWINDGTDDTIISAVSRGEYDALPNKTEQGRPTQFYLERLTTPVAWIWQTPSANSLYTLNLALWRRAQDVGAIYNSPEVPIRFMEALISGLAVKLAVKWRPDRVGMLTGQAEAAWASASAEDRQRVPLRLLPGFNYGRV